MWETFYRLVTTPPAASQPPLEHGYPYYVILESLGSDPAADGERFRAVVIDCMDAGWSQTRCWR